MEDLLEEWLSAPAAHPAARLAIEALDPIAREELDQELEPIDLRAGETLFAGGDPVTPHSSSCAAGSRRRNHAPRAAPSRSAY